MNNDQPLQLRDFVAETIKQVIAGVVIAQPYATSKKAVVNPHTGRYSEQPAQPITFDVAVTAGKGTKTQGGIAVFIGGLGLGSKGQIRKKQRIRESHSILNPGCSAGWRAMARIKCRHAQY